jgi:F-type H+-transporting ATPase subunit gamma
MTDRLAEIGARIDGIRQLGSVVNAMRGIAAARAVQARGQLGAVDSFTKIVVDAIGRVLAMAPSFDPGSSEHAPRPGLVLFCAEEGFAGAFSERVLDAVTKDLGSSEIFLIGTRGISVAAQRGVTAGWTGAMPSHSPGIPRLADTVATAIYASIASGKLDRLDAVFSQAQASGIVQVNRIRLLPFDPGSVPNVSSGDAPLLNLKPGDMLAALTADYLYAQLCHAALHAFAAENEARMAAMAAAHSQIDRKLSSLQAKQRQVRQEQITAEIIELSSGEIASRGDQR